MRQSVAAFAMLMERKLAENDYKGGWDGKTIQHLFRSLKKEVEELGKELDGATVNASAAAFEAVDVANFAMMVVDNLVGGKLSKLPKNLAGLEKTSRFLDTKHSGRSYRWTLLCRGGDPRIMSGKVYSPSEEAAMVAVRDAAILDKVERPFEIALARSYRVDDEVIQRTAEVT